MNSYKHAGRNGAVSGSVVRVLLQVGAFLDESSAGGGQSLFLEVS